MTVTAGETSTIELVVENEDFDRPIRSVSVTLSGGALAVPLRRDGWLPQGRGTTFSWRGGSIAPDESERLPMRVTFPKRPGAIRVSVLEGVLEPSNETAMLSTAIVVEARGGGSHWKLVVAIVAAVLAAGAFFLALANWLRR